MADLPPLPPGFTLDRPSGLPPLPPGFTLDQPSSTSATPPEDIGRVAGLTGRAALTGVQDVATAPVSILNLLDKGAYVTRQKVREFLGLPKEPEPAQQQGPDIAGMASDALGFSNPQGRGEQLYSAAIRGAAGAGVVGPGAGVNALRAAIPGATSGAASEGARQAGAGPVGQFVAGAAAGGATSLARAGGAAAVRGAMRGSSGQPVQNALDTFEAAGTTPTVGQATGGRIAQGTESLLSRVPGGAGVMAGKAQQQAQQIGSRLDDLAEQLSPGSSGETAGRAIQQGVTGAGGFVEQFKAQSKDLYDKLDQYVQPNTKFALPKTTAVLDQLTQPIYGAEKTSNFFINSKVAAIKDALQADLQAGGDSLPYEAVKKLRTLVGNQLADAPLAGDVPLSQWKKLYGAMTSDLEMNAKAVGPGAEAALSRANTYYAAASKRLDMISSVIDRNGGPEQVFKAATSGTKEGATTLRAVMQSLPTDAQKTVAAAVLKRLGRAKAGVQDDTGDLFSTESFLTNWNTLSPAAKNVLFNRFGPQFRDNMDQIANAAANLRAGSAVFRNPSGTGQAVAQTTAAATFLGALLTGNFHAAGGVAAGVVGSNLAARLLTNPNAVRWLANSTSAPANATPYLISQLSRSSDPDLREFGSQLGPNNPGDQGDKGKRE